MQFRGWALPLLLAGLAWTISTAHAAPASNYRAARDAATVASFDAGGKIADLLTTRAGQVVEMQGMVCGVVSGTNSNSFLLRVNNDQTVMICTAQEDPDIDVGNSLRVLVRVPTKGQLFDCLAAVAADQAANVEAAKPKAAPAETPVASRPAETYPTNPDTAPPVDTTNTPLSGIIKRYADRIRIWNGRLNEDTATKIATCMLNRCDRYSVDPRLMFALLAQESRFNPNAVSTSGAQGLGQLMPGTADYLGVRHAFDIEDNIDGAVRYLAEQMRTFGRLSLALAAYNAGPKSVKRYGGIPPYRETQHYVRVIWQTYCALAGLDPSSGELIASR